MGRFLPPAAFREDFGCVRRSSAYSGVCISLGRKLKQDEPIDSQFCEDNVIERTVGETDRIFGVFDGHGGHKCSHVASEQLVCQISKMIDMEDGIKAESIVSSFKKVDEDWCSSGTSDESGTTATIGVLRGTTLTIAHVGDTRAVMIEKSGTCRGLTTCHRASNACERDRIIARGGEVPEYSQGECARVNGVIEVTRSLGDRWLKPVLDCTPDVSAHTLGSADMFLVLGSDGLFDTIPDETLGRYVMSEAKSGKTPADIAFAIAKMAYRNGSSDDISAYVLDVSQDKCAAEVAQSPLAQHEEECRVPEEPMTPVQRNCEGSTDDPTELDNEPLKPDREQEASCSHGEGEDVESVWKLEQLRFPHWKFALGACLVLAGVVLFSARRCRR